MRGCLTILFVFTISTSLAYAEDVKYSPTWGIFTPPPIARYKVVNVPMSSSHLKASLRYLSQFDQMKNVVNQFCIIGYAYNQQQKTSKDQWMLYWKTTQRLIRWELPRDPTSLEDLKASLIFSKPNIDLTNLVPVLNPYAMAEWEEKGVMQVVQDCIEHGDFIVIKSFNKKPVKLHGTMIKTLEQ